MTPALARMLPVAIAAIAAIAAGCDDGGKQEGRPRASSLAAGSSPSERARVACLEVEAVQEGVKHNEHPARVFARLDVAVREISLAAQSEPMWLSLQSGIEAVRRGLQQDDEAASGLGIAIARDQCRRAGVFLPGAVSPEPQSSQGGG